MQRREFIQGVTTGVTAASIGLLQNAIDAADSKQKKRLGLVQYCCRFQRTLLKQQDGKDLYDPFVFSEYCHENNAGGMQVKIGQRDNAYCKKFKELNEANHLFFEAIVSPPKNKTDVPRFEKEVISAKSAGAIALRTTIIPGRRYEQFKTYQDFKQAAETGKIRAELATPVVEKHKIPLAIENHKDQTNHERIALFNYISSEYIGACLDTGNSFALLEDPVQTIKDFAPWTHSVHLKDQALQFYDDGFLLADIPLGQGNLDLKTFVEIIKKERPHVQFSLELITRDPLKVTCLTDQYWASMPQVSGLNLAKTIKYIQNNHKDKLPEISNKTLPEQVVIEKSFVKESLQYAASELGL